jgi:hypothetical protein
MKTATIKTKILIIQTIDWVLLVGIFTGGIYGVLHTDHRFFTLVAALFALALFHQFGRWSYTKLASLRHDLKQVEKGSVAD